VHSPPRGQGTTKFKHQWRGPGKLIEDIGYDNWKIEFLDDRSEFIAHVSQLVPYHHKHCTKIMYDIVNDWCQERMVRETGNEEDGISWLYDNESQEIMQNSMNNGRFSQEQTDSWNDMVIQSQHFSSSNCVFTEVCRKFRRNYRTGRQEPWYQIEYIDNSGNTKRKWLNRQQYDELWQHGWIEEEQELNTTEESQRDAREN
jgi:hypothetical protein